LGDFQAELLVAGQDASKVCARDVKRFCGKGAMKTKHPIHCLGLLPDEQRSQIHRLCRNHLQQSLGFTCANDLVELDCDDVMQTKIDCLTEGIERISEDCADQVRLTAKVMAKVNNAEIKVETQDGVVKYHSGEYENENWQCPANFMEHHTHAPCCFFSGDCAGGEGLSKFQCAQRQCKAMKGQWTLKDEEGFELGGHLCCPPYKKGFGPSEGADRGDAADVLAHTVYSTISSPTSMFVLLAFGYLCYKHRDFIKDLIAGDIKKINLPGFQIELTTFLQNTIFSAVKKESDFARPPQAQSGSAGLVPEKSNQVPMQSYGGL